MARPVSGLDNALQIILGINSQELIDEINRLLKRACRDRRKLGAINWGDLAVRGVEYRLSIFPPADKPTCVVVIEEAAPDCKLPEWISERLDKVKFPSVCIECEW